MGAHGPSITGQPHLEVVFLPYADAPLARTWSHAHPNVGEAGKCSLYMAAIFPDQYPITVEQGFSTCALLTFWAALVFVMATALCIVGSLAASLASTHQILGALLSCDNRICLQILPDNPWGGKITPSCKPLGRSRACNSRAAAPRPEEGWEGGLWHISYQKETATLQVHPASSHAGRGTEIWIFMGNILIVF